MRQRYYKPYEEKMIVIRSWRFLRKRNHKHKAMKTRAELTYFFVDLRLFKASLKIITL